MSCDSKNPIQRNGTSQQERMPAALDSSYVLVDEKDYKDWIVFANQFGAFLNYFDNNNKQNGNWQPFFNSDISAILGTIAIQDINDYRRTVKEQFDTLRAEANKNNEPLLKETLNGLFGCLLTLCEGIDACYLKLPDNNNLKNTIANLVQSKLQDALSKLLADYKGAVPNLVQDAQYDGWQVLNIQITNPSSIIASGSLSAMWINNAASLKSYYLSITANTEIYGSGSNTEMIRHIANHTLFTGIFDQFLQAFTRIINDAETQLLATLADWNDHTPHYALFITFLKLFQYSKAQINTLTQRHLDFYYKEVLQLMPRAEVPDNALLIVELAKQVDEYMLTKGTLFKAGKDSQGKDVVYALANNTVFNKAAIGGLMSIYKGTSDDKIGNVFNNHRYFASPVANSQDGMGAELKSANKEWHPFVNKEYTNGVLTAIDMPKAQIGFAIASHYLYLTEGQRTVDLNIVFTDQTHYVPHHLICYVTTDKGWYKVANPAVRSSHTKDGNNICSTVSFTLSGNEPAITNYNAAVHQGNFNCALPIVKVYVQNTDELHYYYDKIKHFTIESVEVDVTVGTAGTNYNTTGIKQLLLSGDSGPLDSSKPFQPFGAQPKAGNSIVIGNKEVFSKKGAQVLLNIEWKNLPDSTSAITYPTSATPPDVTVKHLANGTWTNEQSVNIFGSSTNSSHPDVAVVTAASQPLTLNDSVIVDYTDTYTAYNAASNRGFLKLSLNKDFGMDQYQDDKVNYLVDLAAKATDRPQIKTQLIDYVNSTHDYDTLKNDIVYYAYYGLGNPPAKPSEPYTPKIASLYLSYTANTGRNILTDKSKYDSRNAMYFHLHPFGEAEQHAYLDAANDTTVNFLTQFTHTENQKPVDDIAEFFIGFTNLQPQQGVNVLFQISEGTSDPAAQVQGTLLHWSYLGNNTWYPFADQDVSDNTMYLRQSGIISFQVPEDATTDNTILPPGMLWFKASIAPPNTPSAVCKLLTVSAQAAEVMYVDNSNAADYLNAAMAANTISKLKNSVSAIKKISQPYPSFGGKPVETGSHFYLRVSERLRHKDRAITIWDYERLVLEAFPGIHRVKCLNHTKYENGVCNESAPGNVTVITVPDLTNHNEINPLRPYTNADVISQIQDFLNKRISCHVQLNVCNPVFEEVKLAFSLKLLPGYEFSYYSNLLKNSITSFLSPWAFGQSDDLTFGNKIEKSVLINLIESQYYVDYITDVKMYHLTEKDPNSLADEDEIMADMAVSILVSVQASEHHIDEIPDVAAGAKNVACYDSYNNVTYKGN